MSTYVATNNKHSEQLNKRMIVDNHLGPYFGTKRLDEIGMRDVEFYKAEKLKKLKPKTVNNHLTGASEDALGRERVGALGARSPIKWLSCAERKPNSSTSRTRGG